MCVRTNRKKINLMYGKTVVSTYVVIVKLILLMNAEALHEFPLSYAECKKKLFQLRIYIFLRMTAQFPIILILNAKKK